MYDNHPHELTSMSMVCKAGRITAIVCYVPVVLLSDQQVSHYLLYEHQKKHSQIGTGHLVS
jgi:hypothetical protein